MTANFRSTDGSCDCSCSEPLLCDFQNVCIVGIIPGGLMIALINHNTNNLAVIKKKKKKKITHPELVAAVGVNSINRLRCHF